MIDDINADPITVSNLQETRAPDVLREWDNVMRSKAQTISDIRRYPDLAAALTRLTLIADEASVGIGIRWDSDTPSGPVRSKFLSIAEKLLLENKLQSFCWDVPKDSLCVLGKQHTPVKGATFRSLSRYLGRATGLSRLICRSGKNTNGAAAGS